MDVHEENTVRLNHSKSQIEKEINDFFFIGI
jgi:hypothetical protein